MTKPTPPISTASPSTPTATVPSAIATQTAVVNSSTPSKPRDSFNPRAAKSQTLPPAVRKIGSLRLINRFALHYPGRIAIAMVAMMIAAAATLAIPAGFRRIIDHNYDPTDPVASLAPADASAGGIAESTKGTEELASLATTSKGIGDGAESLLFSGSDIAPYFEQLYIITFVMAVAVAVRFYFVSWLGERVVADIRSAVQENLLKLSPRFFEENRPSEIASRMTSDTVIIEQFVGTTVSVALRNAVMGIGGMIYLFSLSPQLTGGLLLGIPIIITPIVLLGKRLRTISRSSQDRVADVGAMTVEQLGAMKIVQAFGQENREAGRFATIVEATFATAKRRILVRAVMSAIVIGLLFGAIITIMFIGVQQVAEGTISAGSVFAFVITGGIVGGAFGALTEVWGDVLRASGAAERLAELLVAQPNVRAPAAPIALPNPAQGRLALHHVEFRYPTRPDMAALHDFSLTINPCETVAIVGPSGAGKSTLFQLVQRFYDPQIGQILLDGVDLTAADPTAIRKRIAIVPQETVIFAASARDNLRYGDWSADDERLWQAARAAHAEDFLRGLPNGLDSFMGEAGARLSGGQRQRIAIARAFLRQAPLLLLDEATSSLDAESERLIQQALVSLRSNRTTIIIAHRLATVRAVDRIIVMDEGRIVEQGTHAKLITTNGLYARLARLQFQNTDETTASAANIASASANIIPAR